MKNQIEENRVQIKPTQSDFMTEEKKMMITNGTKDSRGSKKKDESWKVDTKIGGYGSRRCDESKEITKFRHELRARKFIVGELEKKTRFRGTEGWGIKKEMSLIEEKNCQRNHQQNTTLAKCKTKPLRLDKFMKKEKE